MAIPNFAFIGRWIDMEEDGLFEIY